MTTKAVTVDFTAIDPSQLAFCLKLHGLLEKEDLKSSLIKVAVKNVTSSMTINEVILAAMDQLFHLPSHKMNSDLAALLFRESDLFDIEVMSGNESFHLIDRIGNVTQKVNECEIVFRIKFKPKLELATVPCLGIGTVAARYSKVDEVIRADLERLVGTKEYKVATLPREFFRKILRKAPGCESSDELAELVRAEYLEHFGRFLTWLFKKEDSAASAHYLYAVNHNRIASFFPQFFIPRQVFVEINDSVELPLMYEMVQEAYRFLMGRRFSQRSQFLVRHDELRVRLLKTFLFSLLGHVEIYARKYFAKWIKCLEDQAPWKSGIAKELTNLIVLAEHTDSAFEIEMKGKGGKPAKPAKKKNCKTMYTRNENADQAVVNAFVDSLDKLLPSGSVSFKTYFKRTAKYSASLKNITFGAKMVDQVYRYYLSELNPSLNAKEIRVVEMFEKVLGLKVEFDDLFRHPGSNIQALSRLHADKVRCWFIAFMTIDLRNKIVHSDCVFEADAIRFKNVEINNATWVKPDKKTQKLTVDLVFDFSSLAISAMLIPAVIHGFIRIKDNLPQNWFSRET